MTARVHCCQGMLVRGDVIKPLLLLRCCAQTRRPHASSWWLLRLRCTATRGPCATRSRTAGAAGVGSSSGRASSPAASATCSSLTGPS
eukprot:2161706-Pleurochrysis_carterae.AAC.1